MSTSPQTGGLLLCRGGGSRGNRDQQRVTKSNGLCLDGMAGVSASPPKSWSPRTWTNRSDKFPPVRKECTCSITSIPLDAVDERMQDWDNDCDAQSVVTIRKKFRMESWAAESESAAATRPQRRQTQQTAADASDEDTRTCRTRHAAAASPTWRLAHPSLGSHALARRSRRRI